MSHFCNWWMIILNNSFKQFTPKYSLSSFQKCIVICALLFNNGFCGEKVKSSWHYSNDLSFKFIKLYICRPPPAWNIIQWMLLFLVTIADCIVYLLSLWLENIFTLLQILKDKSVTLIIHSANTGPIYSKLKNVNQYWTGSSSVNACYGMSFWAINKVFFSAHERIREDIRRHLRNSLRDSPSWQPFLATGKLLLILGMGNPRIEWQIIATMMGECVDLLVLLVSIFLLVQMTSLLHFSYMQICWCVTV